jgi:hypothetical protein
MRVRIKERLKRDKVIKYKEENDGNKKVTIKLSP